MFFAVYPSCWFYQLLSPIFHCLVSFLEKAMATHLSTLAWKIPWMEEPGRLQSLKLLRVGHNWVTSLSLFALMHWRRKWQPTPVFLPGESQGWGSLVGCRLWGRTRTRLKWLSNSNSNFFLRVATVYLFYLLICFYFWLCWVFVASWAVL